jgi:phosphatidylglycerophosphate synthase
VKRWAADALSLSRLALLGPLAWCLIRGSLGALPIMAVIVATDLMDGPIARLLSTAGSRGALVDSGCDALVVMTAAFVLGLSDARYAGFAGLIAVTFISYGVSSLVIGRFAYTRLGRYDGVVCYGVVAFASAKPALAAIGISLPAAEWIVLCVSAVFLAASTAENVVGILMSMRRKTACVS